MPATDEPPSPDPPASPAVTDRTELLPRLLGRGAAWAALGVSLAITLLAWHYARQTVRGREHEVFVTARNQISDSIKARMENYTQVLKSARALFTASEGVTREEWSRYVETLHLQDVLPGLQSMGFLAEVPSGDEAAFIERIRAGGLEDFAIYPPVREGRASRAVALYVEPFRGRNRRVLGFDIYSEENRRRALEHARDSGEATLSDRLVLVQESTGRTRPGVLLVLPLYAGAGEPATVAERRARLEGYLFGAFHMDELIGSILQRKDLALHVEIHDGDPQETGTLLYASPQPRPEQPFLAESADLPIGGQRWTLRIASLPAFEEAFPLWEPRAVALGGATLSALLFALLSLYERHRRAEHKGVLALADSRERYQVLVQTTSSFVLVVDAEGILRRPQPSWEAFTGQQEQEYLGLFWGESLHDEDRAAIREAWEATHGEADLFECTCRIWSASRQAFRTCRARFAQLRQGEGDLAQENEWIGAFHDIEAHQRTEEARRESDWRLDLALEAARIGTLTWELKSGRLFLDTRMQAIFGLAPGTFEETYEAFLRCVHPDDREGTRRALDDSIARGAPYLSECRVVWPDGSVRYVRTIASIFRDLQERPSKLAGVCLDVTDSKLSEIALARRAEQLASTNRTLEHRNRELDEFTYIASHDLQEPLRKLISFGDMLREDLGENVGARVAQDLDFIIDAAGRMQQLVQDLLSLTRAGRASLRNDPVGLETVLDRVLETLSPRIRETGARVERDPLPVVRGDAVLFGQLFQNLISNALKFVGDRPPRIRITCKHEEDGWVLGVRDNGIGIKPSYSRQIFAPFKRLHGRSDYPGSGIGLSICRKVVDRHGGRIWVESEPGDGAHFLFTFPRERIVGRPGPAADPAAAGRATGREEPREAPPEALEPANAPSRS